MSVDAPRYLRRIEQLKAVDRSVLDVQKLRIATEGALSLYYGPFDDINRSAKLVLIGLTPGWTEVQIAYRTYQESRTAEESQRTAMRTVKQSASFAGMRNRLCSWLDQLGVPNWLGIETTTDLFSHRRDLLHPTSLIRYPVFVGPGRRNYTGHSPRPLDSAMLMGVIAECLEPELAALPDALIVPMGKSVNETLKAIAVSEERCLYGFPHPSGANAHAPREFAEHSDAMRHTVASFAERAARVDG